MRQTPVLLMVGHASSHGHADRRFWGEGPSKEAKECDMKNTKLHIVLAAFLAEIEAM